MTDQITVAEEPRNWCKKIDATEITAVVRSKTQVLPSVLCALQLGIELDEISCRYSMMSDEQIAKGRESKLLQHAICCDWQFAFRSLVKRRSKVDQDGNPDEATVAELKTFTDKLQVHLKTQLPSWLETALANTYLAEIGPCCGTYDVADIPNNALREWGPVSPVGDSRKVKDSLNDGDPKWYKITANVERQRSAILLKFKTRNGDEVRHSTKLPFSSELLCFETKTDYVLFCINSFGSPGVVFAVSKDTLKTNWENGSWGLSTCGGGTTGSLPETQTAFRQAGDKLLICRAVYDSFFIERYSLKDGSVDLRFSPQVDFPLSPEIIN
ncbi:hypothetical protein [Stratiformator vulcanicus]|uniref:hypothetical protein n=1 Tax=Stratiformator vulcanicus TaxID=2527980 RepID=UPI00119CF337|nr:hypothetical protein [Stratiformator vulcanicus]